MRGLQAGANRVTQDAGGGPPPPSDWTYDFTDDANGDPTGWTTVSGLEVGNATVISGLYRCPQNWWQTTTRMDTPTLTTNRRRITAEFVWDATDSAIEVGIRNLDGSLKNSVSLEAAGNWAGISQGGFDGANGTYTAPGIGTPFTVEWTWYGGPTGAPWVHAVGSVKINGVTIGSSVFNNVFTPASGIYAVVFMKGTAGLRKIRYEDPDATVPAVFTDDFNRVNGGVGADWAGSWNVATNKAVRDTTEFVRYAVPMPTADHWIEADVDIQGQYMVLNARGQDVLGANCYQGFIDAGTGQAKIGMMSGGSYSDVAAGSTGLGTGPYKGRLEVQGTAIRFYRNGTLVASTTNSTQTTGLYVGFNGSGSIGSIDNFRAGPLPYVP